MRISLIFLLLLTGCQTVFRPSRESVVHTLPGDTRTLSSLLDHQDDLQRSILEFRKNGQWKKRNYFSARETDQAEFLLFRLQTAHHELSGISGRYHDFGPESEGFELHVKAHQLAVKQASFFVSAFAGDSLAIAEFNRAYPRTGISRHTYDRLASGLEGYPSALLKSFENRGSDLIEDFSYSVQAETFYRVSRLKSPGAHLVKFSEAQKEEVLGQLRPGDLILTYTAGYASDVFIPGSFKHAITFVGSPAQREAEGLTPARLLKGAGSLHTPELAKNLKETTTTGGRPANLIEAVAEGVKFSNLAHIMDTHINRLVVLRPWLSIDDRAIFLGRTFGFLGQEYDFRFDFADASRQVCTELTWRALTGLEGLQFPLTRRGGHFNLSADDIVHYWLEKNPRAFSCILYAEEAPLSPGHRGKIFSGSAADRRLRDLMKDHTN